MTPSADGGTLDVFRVTAEGVLLASRMGAAGAADRWRLPLGPPYRPRDAWVAVAAPRGAGGPVVVAAHRQTGDRHSRWTLVSPGGKPLVDCVWRPYDPEERVEFTPGGDIVVATRTTRRPRLNGSSDVADRFVEIHSTRGGTLLGRFRSTGFVQDGTRVFGRSGSRVVAHAVSDGRLLWSVDVGEGLAGLRGEDPAPLHLAGDRLLVQTRATRTAVVLDRGTGEEVWRAVLPGEAEAVHETGPDRFILQYRGGLAFAGPRGVERAVSVPPPGNSGRQRVEHLAVVEGAATVAVIDAHKVSAPELVVVAERGRLARRPLRIAIPAAHAQAVLTRSAVYLLPWAPDGRQATLHAYDLKDGAPLWRVPVPDRLTITDGPGPGSSLHPYRGGLYGTHYASGWTLPAAS
ncbi:PQQ-binding-like beta-propeller repeat protein [Streptomyces sp. ODS05-4]|uniref:outer membrane protein assembly factor BamB family protein n=1 Tax=Streptomyces sp. ODS05-4 TaxID=2944939 RepID=UPI00210881BF|nr:PQQ-binding-like beta-propeller repeat protein [Streptomyces sp. ODS05-4]